MKSKLNCVLLIDDDEPTNFLNRWIIEHSGLAEKVQVAPSGQAALDFLTSITSKNDFDLKTAFPSLILLDINMPAMNGWEFLDRYKALRPDREIKSVIVMLTTSLFPEDKLKAAADPEVSGFESKPFTPEVLAEIMSTHFKDN